MAFEMYRAVLCATILASLCQARPGIVVARVPSSYTGGFKWVLYQEDPNRRQALPVQHEVGVKTSPVNTKKVTIYRSKFPGMKATNDHDTEVIESLTGVPDLPPPYGDYENYPGYWDYQDAKRPAKPGKNGLRVFQVRQDAVDVTGPSYQ